MPWIWLHYIVIVPKAMHDVIVHNEHMTTPAMLWKFKSLNVKSSKGIFYMSYPPIHYVFPDWKMMGFNFFQQLLNHGMSKTLNFKPNAFVINLFTY